MAGLLCYCGCTAPQTFNPFGWMHGSSTSQASSSPDKANPLKPADQVAADGDSSGSKDDATKSADANSADKPGSNGFKAAAIDPALRKLMEQELASESPEERKHLLEQWSKFDPAFIRELVDNHRMAREMADGRQHPVKLASAESTQDSQFGDLDLPAPTKSPKQPAAPATPVAPSGPSGGSASNVSPWSESADMPAVPTSPQAASSSSSNSTTALPPATPAAASAPPNGPSTADAFDMPPATPQPARVTQQPASPLSILPLTQPPNSGRTSAANSGAAPPPSQTASTPAAPVTGTKGDAFAGMGSLDDAPASLPASPPAARSTPAAAPTPTAVALAPPANSPAPASDGISIQPGLAAPASVISNLQTAQKGSPSVSAFADMDAATSSPSLDAPPAVRTPGPTGSPAPSGDNIQPVQLQPPTDIPSNANVTPAAGTKSITVAEATTPAPSGSASPSSSGLAGLSNKILGAISPNLTSAVRTASQSGNWHDELQKIVTVAAAEAGQTSAGTTDAETLKYVEKQVQLRMLYLLAGQPAKSLEPISGLDAPDQEFWQQVFWGVSNYFDKTAMADPSDRATQTITQLRTAVNRLQEKSKLELRNVAFCQKIVNYGNYERMKRDEFTPGQPVLLYAEVENFKSEPTTDGPYRTILKSTVEIFDSRGQLVQSMPYPPTDDLCASPRRDYYNSYEFAIPQRIGLGAHTLKLTVEDQISRKVATYTVNFTVK
ncbi:MAG TPA: hypothetical protein VHX68_08475 [Planctomycetaceae bacterium]|nr:hypothetical protein [Planctomycetaceae bacterium]